MMILAGASLDDGCKMMKTSFYGYWYWILDVGLTSMMSAAGSPSLVGWCDALSHKLKITSIHPKIWNNINLEQSFPLSTT